MSEGIFRRIKNPFKKSGDAPKPPTPDDTDESTPEESALQAIKKKYPGAFVNIAGILEEGAKRFPDGKAFLVPGAREAAIEILSDKSISPKTREKIVDAFAQWEANTVSAGSGGFTFKDELAKYPALTKALSQAFNELKENPRKTTGAGESLIQGAMESSEERRVGGIKVSEIVSDTNEAVRPSWRQFDQKNYIGVKQKTLAEILENPQYAQLFGELLESADSQMWMQTGGQIGASTFAGAELSVEAVRFLDFGRYEFSKWVARAESVASKINANDVELATRRDKDLDSVAGLKGNERTAQVFKEQVLHLAMKEPGRFQDLESAYKSLRNDQSTARYNNWDEKVRDLCKKVAINPRDFDATFDLTKGNRADTRERLNARLRADMGTFRKSIDWTLSTVGLGEADRALDKAEDIVVLQNAGKGANRLLRTKMGVVGKGLDLLSRHPTSWVVNRINENLEVITSTMAHTISENPSVRHILVQEALAQKTPQLATETGPKTRMEAVKYVESHSRSAVVANWEKDKSTVVNAAGEKWNHWTDTVQAGYRDNWDATKGVQSERGTGFFARIFMAFFQGLWTVDEKRHALSLDKTK